MTATLLNPQPSVTKQALDRATAWRYGELVVVYVVGAFAAGWNTLGTLGADYRAEGDVVTSLVLAAGIGKAAILEVKADGTVRVHNPDSVSRVIAGNAVYPAS